jgi:hypothetical protein
MDSTTKRLFSEIINYTRNNDCEFIFVSGDNVVIKPKNENNANCFKKVKKDEKDEWENKSFDANKVLRAFNLIYQEEAAEEEVESVEPEELESDEEDDVDNIRRRLNHIPIGIIF